ncbi:MAG TPA: acVLRF1 family peptidyl-tRNA hydrolase [Jatrophihabitans sp.]|nr:acVLRF1 family peptidyl-tRNA hydrolase [Jatrophihabitans sp.]
MDVPAGARTVTVAADRLARWLAGFGERHGATTTTTTADVVELAGADGARAWLAVPFPPLAGELVPHVTQRRRVGVLLVRRGGYAVGVFDGADLVASKVGSSYVQATTKAGGWSQQRYARRRANQASVAFGAAADVAARLLPTASLDALVVGGDRDAVRGVLADARLAALPAPADPWLQVKDPRLRVLAATPEQFRAVRIHLVP